MKKFFLAAAFVATLTAGCASVPAAPVASAPAGSNQPPVITTPETTAPAPEPAAQTNAPAQDGVATFGSSYEWEDGLAMTIGIPEAYSPGKYAAGTDQFKEYVVLDVTIVNNTGAPWDPVMIYATMQSSNQEGSRVFDSGQLPPEPSTKLLNGREVKFKMAFGVADPSDLVLEVQPDWDHQSVLFHG